MSCSEEQVSGLSTTISRLEAIVSAIIIATSRSVVRDIDGGRGQGRFVL